LARFLRSRGIGNPRRRWNVLGGEQDYNDADFVGIQSPEPSGDIILPGSGALVVDPATGQGTLTLTTNNPNVGEGGYETLAVQFVNLNHALIVQFDGSATSSGSMDLQTLSSALNDGNYAFTLTGEDPGYASLVLGGVFSISSGGTAVSGTFDLDDFGATGSTPTLGTPFTGTITGPDAFGRGTITSADLPANALNYYVVGPEAIRIIDVDPSDSGVGSAFGQARVPSAMHRWKIHIRCREQRGGWKSLCRGGHVCHGFHGRHVHWLRGRQ